MRDCFNIAIAKVLQHEGGFSNHPDDPGGATNYGISLRWLKSQGLYGDMDDDGDVDVDDIMSLEVDDAVRIYREKWWDKYGYDRIKDCALATKVMDISVNMGPSRAHRILQRSINTLGGTLTVDGVLGPMTILATNTTNGQALLEEIRQEQGRYYMRLIAKKPAFAVFKNGWMKRAMS